MERRNRSLEALKELYYVDSLEASERADGLLRWYEKYLSESDITSFDLELEDLKILQELFYKNIEFLKKHKEDVRKEMLKTQKMKRFLKN